MLKSKLQTRDRWVCNSVEKHHGHHKPLQETRMEM